MTAPTAVDGDGASVRPPDQPEDERRALRGEPSSGRRLLRGLREVVVLGGIALGLAFLIKVFLLQAFYIPSGSMLDTLQLDDRLLVEKVSYLFSEPERGDVVVFRRPNAPERTGVQAAIRSFLEGFGVLQPNVDIDLVKRVIGLPGETVSILDGVVQVDGRALDEPYVLPDGRSFSPVTVPEGHYFMLGDNRGNSDDSRYTLGLVPRENFVGRAFAIIWPLRNATTALGHEHDV